tara:strand:- start:1443 stop:1805 length:363 start_codon:yes stop_codon:yes gene_type:complete
MTENLSPIQAEKIIQEYESYGKEHAKLSRIVCECEIEIQRTKDQNLAKIKASGSVAKDKALANSDSNILPLIKVLLDAQEKRDVALIKRNALKMKFEKWKADTFEKTNQEFFEKKVYSKT